MTAAALDSNLIAMLATVVTASVFSIGLVSHRSHVAMADSRRRLREHPDERDEESELVGDAGSFVVILLNGILAGLVVIVAAVVLATKDGLTTEEVATLVCFAFIEVAVVIVGSVDHNSAKKKVTAELDDPTS